MDSVWENIVVPPLPGRLSKPRSNGVTMLIDKGLSIGETRELLIMNAPFIDFIKLTFGTAALYPLNILKDKITLAKDYGVHLYPGGTFFEICFWSSHASQYFRKLNELGFEWVKISDGTLQISPQERSKAILKAIDSDLQVITEVGKKNPLSQPEASLLVDEALQDFELGAKWVIIEARESGHGIGIYDSNGSIIEQKLSDFSNTLPLEKVIWEAPLKNQQAQLINTYGPNVNLGNIPPTEIMALEALRNGLRSDTWPLKTISLC